MSTSKPPYKRQRFNVEEGRRSGLENEIASQLEAAGVPYEYEKERLSYTKKHVYIPDFILANGIIIEGKGRFTSADRSKMLAVKAEHPERDIRFVFSRSSTKIRKGSKTSYADWCEKSGFPFADKIIPLSWLKEKSK